MGTHTEKPIRRQSVDSANHQALGGLPSRNPHISKRISTAIKSIKHLEEPRHKVTGKTIELHEAMELYDFLSDDLLPFMDTHQIRVYIDQEPLKMLTGKVPSKPE